MSLVEVRQQFVQISGRYDLVVDSDEWANNGADFYINAGQKWLERRFNIFKEDATEYVILSIGNWYALIQQCRAIKQVWASDALGNKWQLEKRSLKELREWFTTIPTGITFGSPIQYTLSNFRTIPEEAGTTVVDVFGSTTFSIAATDHYSYNGILVMPPSDGTITLEVKGTFFHPVLVEDEDTNYFSEELLFPLVLSSCRALEMTYRNTVGVKDWTEAIMSEMTPIEMDLADQESSDYDLEG